MTSEDRVIIELINSRFDAMERRFEVVNGQIVQLDKKVDELKAEVAAVRQEVHTNATRVDSLQSYTNTWFTVIAAVITFVGFVVALAPMFREMYIYRREERRERRDYVTRADMEEAISSALTKALGIRQS